MSVILVPVDGSANADRAVQAVIRRAAEGHVTKVHLLNVQPEIRSGHVKRFFSQEDINAFYQEEGAKELASAKALLDAAGTPYEAQIVAGQTAEAIVAYAKANAVTEIVIGTRGHGAVVGMFLGSVTTKVVHLSDVPVTLIK